MLARQSQQQNQAAAAAALGPANDSFQQFGQCKMRTSVLRELIEDYRKSEVLWNSNLKNYYNKSLRQQAVQKLAIKYQCSEVDINSKIKNLRTYFLKELKKSATITENGQPYQSTWFAFDSMLFVKEHIKPRRSRYNQLMRLIQDAQDCANQEDDQNELDDESDTGDDEMSDIVQLSDDDDQPEVARKFSVAHLAIAESSSHSSVELNAADGENLANHLAEPGQSAGHKRPASEPDLAVNINWRGQQASPNSRCSLNAESEQSVSLNNRNSDPIRDPTVPQPHHHHHHHHTNHSSSSSSVTDSSPWHQPSNTGKRKSSHAFASPTSTTNAAAAARSLAVGQVPIANETMMDECAIFGALVAQKLRNLPTARFRSLAQNRICNLLFELEMTVADSSDG